METEKKEVKYYKLNSSVFGAIYREYNGEWQTYNYFTKKWYYSPGTRNMSRLQEITLIEAFQHCL